MDSFPEQPWGPGPKCGTPEPEVRAPVFIEPHWTLFFDGSIRKKRAGAGAVLINPNRDQVKYIVHLKFEATNNMVALSLGVRQLLLKGDSQRNIKRV